MTMLVEIIGAFSKGALTEEILVNGLVTDVGAGLYPYMIFLEHSERKVEAEMLREHRDAIFAVRDKFDQKTINKKEMALEFKRIYTLLTVQMKMLRTIDEKRWECAFLDSYMKDLCGFIYWLEDETKNQHRKEKCSYCNTEHNVNELSTEYSLSYKYLCSSCKEMVSGT